MNLRGYGFGDLAGEGLSPLTYYQTFGLASIKRAEWRDARKLAKAQHSCGDIERRESETRSRQLSRLFIRGNAL